MKHKWLKPKDCPVCEKIIYDFNEKGIPVKLNENGKTFWVRFNDNSKAQFAICKECFIELNQAQINALMEDQKYTWGMEIINSALSIAETFKQWSWFVNEAVFLEIIKWSEKEDGI
jgi:hypothetical protein